MEQQDTVEDSDAAGEPTPELTALGVNHDAGPASPLAFILGTHTREFFTALVQEVLDTFGPDANREAPTTTITGPATTSTAPTTPTAGPATTSTAPTTPITGPATTSTAPTTPITGPATTSTAPTTPITGPATTSAAPTTPIAGLATTSAAPTTLRTGPASTSAAPTTPITGPITTTAPTTPITGPATTSTALTTPFTGPAATWKLPGSDGEFKVYTTASLVRNHPDRFLSLADRLRRSETPQPSTASSEKQQIRVQTLQSGLSGVVWNKTFKRWHVRWREGGKRHEQRFPISAFRTSATSEDEARQQALEAAIACRNEHSTHDRTICRTRGVVWAHGAYRAHVTVAGKVRYCGIFKPADSSQEAHEEAFRQAQKRRHDMEKSMYDVVLSQP